MPFSILFLPLVLFIVGVGANTMRKMSSSSSSTSRLELETVHTPSYYISAGDGRIHRQKTNIKSILIDETTGTIRLPPANFKLRPDVLQSRDVILDKDPSSSSSSSSSEEEEEEEEEGGGKNENDRRNLIFGGTDAVRNQNKYFVTMYEQYCEYTWFGGQFCYDFSVPIGCGATLVAEDFIMTAGHCFPSGNIPASLIFEIGAYCETDILNNNNCNQGTELFFVDGYKRHPDYADLTPELGLFFDLMLFRFDGIATISPVKLDDGTVLNSLPLGQQLTALGFGTTSYTDLFQRPDTLQQVDLILEPNSDCNVYEGQFGSVPEYPDVSFCASALPKGTCRGDSGGPIVLRGSTSAEDIQLGITSFGFGTCGVGYYATVGVMYDWIKGLICNNSATNPSLCQDGTSTPATPSSPTSSSSSSCEDNPNDKITISIEVDCSYLDTPEKLSKYCNDPASDAAAVCKYRCQSCP